MLFCQGEESGEDDEYLHFKRLASKTKKTVAISAPFSGRKRKEKEKEAIEIQRASSESLTAAHNGRGEERREIGK